jgi:hypothetical protein
VADRAPVSASPPAIAHRVSRETRRSPRARALIASSRIVDLSVGTDLPGRPLRWAALPGRPLCWGRPPGPTCLLGPPSLAGLRALPGGSVCRPGGAAPGASWGPRVKSTRLRTSGGDSQLGHSQTTVGSLIAR